MTTPPLLNDRERFYRSALEKSGVDPRGKVLVCGGGECDARVLRSLGFQDVVFGNLPEAGEVGKESSGFPLIAADVENLDFPDNSIDFTVAHAVLHHAARPHAALSEMYRVARRGVLVVEARDSLLLRLAAALNLTEVYETVPVSRAGGLYGGVRNTSIPNYVYRWTEREVEKTIRSLDPSVAPDIRFFYGLALPHSLQYRAGKSSPITTAVRLAGPVLRLFGLLFKRQQNMFGFYIRKEGRESRVFPWIETAGDSWSYRKDWSLRAPASNSSASKRP